MANRVNHSRFFLILFIAAVHLTGCQGQKTFGTEYLNLEKSIAMPGVKGRIDHIDVDIKNRTAYIAALGNNTLEIIDLQNGKLIHSITGLDEPQGVAYIPKQQEIFVANGGNGECYFFNAVSFKKTGTVKLASDADDVRYDSAAQKIYVGYGQGAIAVIDAVTHQQSGTAGFKGHPESFQLDNSSNTIYVNVPDKNNITVINASKLIVRETWKCVNASANFPMAFDPQNHRVFVGYRSPARLEVRNSETGTEINTYTMVGDADDLYYDEIKHRIYVSGGGGFINIFQQQDSNTYTQLANIPTRKGARTSFLIPSLQLLLVNARAESGQNAELMVYKVNK